MVAVLVLVGVALATVARGSPRGLLSSRSRLVSGASFEDFMVRRWAKFFRRLPPSLPLLLGQFASRRAPHLQIGSV